MHKGKIISLVSIILIPISILLNSFIFDNQNYYILSVIILFLSMVPFFVSLENKKLKARELVTIAVMIAIAVAGRAAFYHIPQVKPMCAIVIITAIVFGSQIGFVTGTLSMLISNFIFGQGIWTPFQMFGMGMCGFICGLLFYKRKKPTKPFCIALVGGVVCFFVYGIIVDVSSVLMMSSDFSLGSVISIYMSGVSFNAIHGVSTFIFLILIQPSFSKVLHRIKIKYDLFGGAR